MLPFMGNEPVIFTSKAKPTATVGVNYSYQPEIKDDGKTKITFNLIEGPDGMSIDNTTGLIKWIPTESQIGKHEVSIMVNDGWYKDNQKFTLNVILFQLKSISSIPASMSFTAINSSKNIESITAFYTDDTSKLIDNGNCIFSSSNTAVATVDGTGKVTAIASGSTVITISYSEKEVTKTANVPVTVTYKKPSPGG